MAQSDIFADPIMGEPYLLTPGPLTTAHSVKQAMLRDWGSWDDDFRSMTRSMCSQLLALVGDEKDEFSCVPMQGSGSFCVEAMLGTLVPRNGKVLVLANGAYGLRAAEIMRYIGREFTLIDKGDYMPPRGDEVGVALDSDHSITHVIAIHCETSSGVLNPIKEISTATYARGRKLLIDSMSAFGAIDIDVNNIRYEAMVSSANKCIEGVPGFGFVIARTLELSKCKGNSHSLALDVYAQWTNFVKTGQWRYTPPTHVVAAFLEALRIHTIEGGCAGRLVRYTQNRDVVVAGMRKLGFETLLSDRWLSPIIVTFFCPAHKNFLFPGFYNLMKKKGFIIYPGKLTTVESFRIGCIGRMDENVMLRVVKAAEETLAEMGVSNATPPAEALLEKAKLEALG